MFDWIKNIFSKREQLVNFPSDTSWMLKENLYPNIKNLKKCREFHNLIGCPQDKSIHQEGDVWNHTILTAKEMFRIVSSNSWFLNARDKRILMIASLLHDIGKQNTTTYNQEKDTVICDGHGAEGEKIARKLLMDEDFKAREEICWLVKNHLNFHTLSQEPLDLQIKEILKLSKGHSNIEKMLLLYVADYRATRNDTHTEDNLNIDLKEITEIAMKNDCYIKPYKDNSKEDKFDCKMYVMIGLPGAGKDTYIKKNLPNLPCICRDDIREEIKDGQILGRKLALDKIGELAVTNTVNKRIKNCCINKKDFVINQTSLKKKYRDGFTEIARQYANVEIIYIYIEAPSVEECISRRGGGKWNKIIPSMLDGFEFPDFNECDKLIILKQ